MLNSTFDIEEVILNPNDDGSLERCSGCGGCKAAT